MKLTKVHRAISFIQTDWMKEYIDFNTQERAKATTKFEKDLYKLMNFGKTMENLRSRVNVRLVNGDDLKTLRKLASDPLLADWRAFGGNVYGLHMRRDHILFKRPIYVGIYNTCFPLKKLKRKEQLRKPWLSKGLLKSVKRKNKLYRQYLSDTSAQKEALYKEYRNKLNHSLRIAKRLYYDKKLNESKTNMRATWRLLNDLIYKRKPKLKSNQSFKADELEITNPVAIANKFCQYFSNIGPNLAKGIQSSISHKNFLSGTFNQSIFLTLATEE